MTTQATGAGVGEEEVTGSYSPVSPYDRWIASLNVPIHTGYYIEDLRTVPVGRWEQRECDAAFLQLAGQQGVSGAYVTEIAPGKTIPYHRVAVDEAIYVLQGRGMTTVKGAGSSATKNFEWETRSLFQVPGNFSYQLTNMQGNQPARLLHVSYLPLAMGIVRDPQMFQGDNAPPPGNIDLNRFYAEARAVKRNSGPTNPEQNVWSGNFFPDMKAWDRLDELQNRGAGGRAVMVEFPGSAIRAHMSVFPPQTYKKAHRHGPGFVIVIPAGEGYSVMWPEGSDKVFVPWHEASLFVPPNRWWHQHFNTGTYPDRYLAIHPPAAIRGTGENIEDAKRDQIEYVNEDPWIREKFKEELAKKGHTSHMEEEAYTNPNFKWTTFSI